MIERCTNIPGQRAGKSLIGLDGPLGTEPRGNCEKMDFVP